MFAATLAALLLAAPPAPPTLYVEFDGKGGLNPSVPADGVIAATGTFTLPPGAEFLGVRLEVVKRNPGPNSFGRIITAEADLKAKPHKWTARAERFEPGEYLVTVKLDFDPKERAPGDTSKSHYAEGYELRRVEIRPAK